MRRVYWVFALGCITALLYMAYLAERPVTAVLSQALAAAGATPREICVSGFCRLPLLKPSDADLSAMVQFTMAQLGFEPDQYQLTYGADARLQTVRAVAMYNGVEITALAGMTNPASGIAAQEFIMISAKIKGDTRQADYWYKTESKILSKLGGSPRIVTCLVGWLDGKLEKDAWGAKIDCVGKVLGAASMDTFAEPGYVNTTAYSPALPAWVGVGDKRININMAIRFCPYDNRTYFVIGSPIIVGDY